jgi:hypothetical protein
LKRTVFSIDLQEFLVPKRLCVCLRIRTCWIKQILWCSCNKVHWCTLSLRKSYTRKITCNCTSIKTMYTTKAEALGVANINWFGSCNYPRWARWYSNLWRWKWCAAIILLTKLTRLKWTIIWAGLEVVVIASA